MADVFTVVLSISAVGLYFVRMLIVSDITKLISVTRFASIHLNDLEVNFMNGGNHEDDSLRMSQNLTVIEAQNGRIDLYECIPK